MSYLDWEHSTQGLNDIVKTFPTAEVIFVLNKRGAGEPADNVEKELTEFWGADRVLGFVEVPHKKSDTYDKTIKKMLNEKLTFNEVLEGGATSFNSSQRQVLRIFRRNLYEAFDLMYKPLLEAKPKKKAKK